MVAVLCNDRRAVPKTHVQSTAKMKEKECVGIAVWIGPILILLVTAPWVQVRSHEIAPRHPHRRAQVQETKKDAKEESDLDEDVTAEHGEVQGARDRALREEVFQGGREVRGVGARLPVPMERTCFVRGCARSREGLRGS
jgi:hypothetical protein